MLIKNEQIVSNSSSYKQLKALGHLASSPILSAHQQALVEASSPAMAFQSSAERQQQNPPSTSSLGVSDRMSKEKQKFFRFSVFNSERKSKSLDGKKPSKSSQNNNKSKANHKHLPNGIDDASGGAYDKYKFVSSSDSENEREIICDTKIIKPRGRPVGKKTLAARAAAAEAALQAKAKTKLKTKDKERANRQRHLSSDSSCCSSDGGESGSSSDSSTSSSGSSSSSSGSSTSKTSSCSTPAEDSNAAKASLANKAESINTMNVFACINSRELSSQTQRPPYCWTAMPSEKNHQSESLFKRQSTKTKSFGSSGRNENEVWGFAAEAKKSLNIFTNSDSESRTHRTNFSGTESDCQMSLLSLGSASFARHRPTRGARDSSRHPNHQLPSLAALSRSNAKIANDYLLSNRRTTSLMRNNAIMSSDDDAAKELSPSKLFRKAVSYKKFDNNTLNNKKLIMDTSLNGAKYGCDERPVKEPAQPAGLIESSETPSAKQSQPPYNNNSNNQSDLGKKLSL